MIHPPEWACLLLVAVPAVVGVASFLAIVIGAWPVMRESIDYANKKKRRR